MSLRVVAVLTVLAATLALAAAASAATWSPTGSMSNARYRFTQTSLSNGKVLVAGGLGASGTALASAELYDPSTGTWSTTGSMTTARYGQTATLLSNGDVLVAGGIGSSGSALATAELYDPSTGTWSSTGSMSTGRAFAAAILLASSGDVLVAGAFQPGTPNNYLPSAELYDPSTGTWSSTGSMHVAREHFSLTVLGNGNVLTEGGNDGDCCRTGSAELYNPSTGTWTVTGAMSTSRSNQTATLLPSGLVLVTGGFDGSGTQVASAERYDPSAGTWSATGSMSTARANHTATLLSDGNVLVAGGSNSSGVTASAELYDPTAGTWSAACSMSTARNFQLATLLPDGNVLVAGGANSSGTIATAELYGGPSNPSACPSLSITAPTSGSPGSPISASSVSATLSGGSSPLGTITFQVFGPQSSAPTDCSSGGTTVGAAAATGDGTYNPSAGFTPSSSGDYWWYASYSGDTNNYPAASTCGAGMTETVVNPASPSISTSQQPTSATVGSSVADQATVSGGFNPTGTVTFNLYDNPNGTGTPLFTDANEPLSGGKATSKGYTTTATGTDYWVATYNGDANNNSVSSGNASEPVTVSPASPSISTSQQPASATVGSSVADQATVSGGANPTGTVTFNLYNDPNGTGTPLFADTEPLSGGKATSKGYTTTATGTDYWVATYNGDANNNPASSGSASEPVTVSAASPSISTSQQPASATVGSSVADQATVSGGDRPTGTVTFSLYNNPSGTGTPLFTDANEPLSGGRATSKGYTTSATGTDYWVATYNGDANNNSISSGNASEPVSVGAASPSISTSQQPSSATVGSSVADQATVSGGDSPTGTVTFNLYNNPNGTGTPLFTDATEPLSGGTATSRGYTTTSTGTDYWVATYNGDANNNPVSSGNADEPVTVSAASPSISASAPGSGTAGSTIPATSVSASLSGGESPSGTITFKVFGPQSSAPSDCSSGGTTVGTATASGDGTYHPSAGFTPSQAGNYWWYTSYAGDSNNNSAASTCGPGMAETVVGAAPRADDLAVSTSGPVSRSGSRLDPGITLSCPSGGASCTATEIVTVAIGAWDTPDAGKPHPAAVGAATFTIPAGSTVQADLELNGLGMALLSDHKHLPMQVGVSGEAQGQPSVSAGKAIDLSGTLAHYQVQRLRVQPDGAITFNVKVSAPGLINVLISAWNDNVASAARKLNPAPARFVFARAGRRVSKAGTLRFTVRPDAKGQGLIAHPAYGVTVRLWVSYIPLDAFQTDTGYYGLHPGQGCTSCHLRVWP